MTTLGTNQFMNQFSQTAVRGSLDELLNMNVITAQLNNADVNKITSAGDLVKFNAGANGIPTVEEVEATEEVNENVLYGFVIKNLKSTQYNGNQSIGVALEYSVMKMVAEEPIASGAKVAYDATITTPTNTGMVVNNPSTATIGVIPCGTAIDTATAKGNLIRVLIKF